MPKTATLGKALVAHQDVEQRVDGILVPRCAAISASVLPWNCVSSGFFTAPMSTASGPGISCHSLSHVGRRPQHLRADARARRLRILQALEQLVVAAVVGPRRNERGEGVVPGRVAVGVGGDVDAGLRAPRRSWRRSPACGPSSRLPAALMCQISTGIVRLAPDPHGLVERVDDGIALRCACASRRCRRACAASAASAISSSVFA